MGLNLAVHFETTDSVMGGDWAGGHCLPERIRAQASICSMALVLHQVLLNGAQPVSKVSSMTDEDGQMFKAFNHTTDEKAGNRACCRGTF